MAAPPTTGSIPPPRCAATIEYFRLARSRIDDPFLPFTVVLCCYDISSVTRLAKHLISSTKKPLTSFEEHLLEHNVCTSTEHSKLWIRWETIYRTEYLDWIVVKRLKKSCDNLKVLCILLYLAFILVSMYFWILRLPRYSMYIFKGLDNFRWEQQQLYYELNLLVTQNNHIGFNCYCCDRVIFKSLLLYSP